MLAWSILFNAACAAAIVTLTPGPGMLAFLTLGAAQGRRDGAYFLAGHLAGDQFRIGQGFRIISAGLVVGCASEGLRILWIDEPHLDALILQRVGEQVPGTAIEVG